MKPIDIKWMGQPATYTGGLVFGVPFEEGQLNKDEHLVLQNKKAMYKVQQWPTAYWKDGSIKWLGLAVQNKQDLSEHLELVKTSDAKVSPLVFSGVKEGTKDDLDGKNEASIQLSETESQIKVSTGRISVTLNKEGDKIIDSVYSIDPNGGSTLDPNGGLIFDPNGGTKELCNGGQLIGELLQVEEEDGIKIKKEIPFTGCSYNVKVEQTGPIRCVIKFEGKHILEYGKNKSIQRQLFPFTLRLIFFAGSNDIKMTHHFIYDGNEAQDYIKSIGLSFTTSLKSPIYNRQIKFTGDNGSFAENAQFISRRTDGYESIYQNQLDGEFIVIPKDKDWIQDMPSWDHFKLLQNSPNYYSIQKSAKDNCAYILADHGKRALGGAYVGDASHGVFACVKDFWQTYPSGIEVVDLLKEKTTMKLWLWSPDGPPMDMRHYDTETHVEAAYEGSFELDSDPYGVARYNEINLTFFDTSKHVPSHKEVYTRSMEIQEGSRLVCTPAWYHETKALGVFSLENRSGRKEYIEDQLDKAVEFYINEVEQREWYGFWDYGDVMHTYDPTRHKWRYDLGGFAWQNTELAPNMWLWYMFLRSGRQDVFRLAEAMTRHTSEVDVYHLGKYKGLGSRHNVIHWGCGAKEARIAMAGLHRYYYYLTADERMGDMLEEVVDADFSTLNKDPMREYFPTNTYGTHARFGPDWAAYSSNWYTRWERFEDKDYLNKIMVGVESLNNMPYRMRSGSCYEYNPHDGRLHFIGEDTYGFHLGICMGEPEIWMEMADQLPDNRLKEMLIEFGEFYYLPMEEKIKRTGPDIGKKWEWPMFAADITAYAAHHTKNHELANQTWEILLQDASLRCIDLPVEAGSIKKDYLLNEISEIPSVTTNTVSQWCLNVIVCLELIGEYLEEGRSSHEG